MREMESERWSEKEEREKIEGWRDGEVERWSQGKGERKRGERVQTEKFRLPYSLPCQLSTAGHVPAGLRRWPLDFPPIAKNRDKKIVRNYIVEMHTYTHHPYSLTLLTIPTQTHTHTLQHIHTIHTWTQTQYNNKCTHSTVPLW